MADTWRERLLPASFRAVPFLIENTSVPVGRKVQLHQYPKRDDAFAEPMGKVARVHKVTAYVIGADCFTQRDALLDALEAEGEGTLVHPWLGQMAVTVGVGSMKHSRAEGGMVSFELEFYPATPRLDPSAVVNTARLTRVAATSFWSGALARYTAAMAALDSARVSLLGLENALAGVFVTLNQQFAPVGEIFGSLRAIAQMVINAPEALASLLDGMLSEASQPRFERYSGAVAALASQAEDAAGIDGVSTASGADTAAAAQAVANLLQAALLARAVATAAQMPVLATPAAFASAPSLEQQVAQPVARAEVPVADDVIAARDALDAVFWQAALKAGASDYPQINAARQQMVRHLTAVAASGVQLVTLTPPETLPALVLAYRRFGDATREGEIVQRNPIIHPGFVPAVPLQLALE
ncbi:MULTISPECIES: DNA circularization protein [unclassified Pseudomonas]|uniref:DNA circularization protein n=1 Tax=unclassified Pseudomonas TaxID=196821 RepID=UPI000BDB370F|nr:MULTISPECIES: DNA circularization N-terminal domain-containing protein [unclassified Pseudomonas]PVZ12643.1 prophage DNA circulation protein [Pseudomonas sp. URIL14HWK12:I12]PVZ23206.1 prophage DNA circulation protein [Pseudomonas sp. URIL14HWK12:I10]PVZ32535.1 prophage DNA circulation protein [Pseudomonas sp. URIL14HWK12:I11]SNZ13618.1 Mu-like prophage DNA circulation protein [Pseudomonas sp. URIL14HWK12:I9]